MDGWWLNAGNRIGRLRSFLQWLATTPETRVAIVAHWGFLYELLMVECRSPVYLELGNCTHVRTIWSAEPTVTIHAPLHGPRVYAVHLQPDGTATTPRGRQFHRELKNYFAACARDPLLQNADSMRFGGGFYIELADFRPEPDEVSLLEFRGKLSQLAQTLCEACMAEAVAEKVTADDDADDDADAAPAPAGCRWKPRRDQVQVVVHAGENPYVRIEIQDSRRLSQLSWALQKTIFPHRGGRTGVTEGPFVAEVLGTEVHGQWMPTGPIEMEHYRRAAQGQPLVLALLQSAGETAGSPDPDGAVQGSGANTDGTGSNGAATVAEALDAFAELNWQMALVSHGAERGLELHTEATFPV